VEPLARHISELTIQAPDEQSWVHVRPAHLQVQAERGASVCILWCIQLVTWRTESSPPCRKVADTSRPVSLLESSCLPLWPSNFHHCIRHELFCPPDFYIGTIFSVVSKSS
jgi:hypothetical protein